MIRVNHAAEKDHNLHGVSQNVFPLPFFFEEIILNQNKMPGRKTKYHPGYTGSNKVSLVHGGKPYFNRLLQLIASAVHTIHIQVYILDDDETGNTVALALQEAAARNVQVFVLADGYGSRTLHRSFVKKLRDAGVHFAFFEPLFKSSHFYVGRRLHTKIVVVDACFGLVGGINITNRYNDMPGRTSWLDYALYVEGEAATELCRVCNEAWKRRLPALPDCTAPVISFPEVCEVAVRRNDWIKRKNEISESYVQMFRNAQKRIVILCSYFLPGRVIRRKLEEAAKRGVKITLITAGASDVPVTKLAERYLYGWLQRHKVEIYEYHPVILHGKLAVADGQWLTIGSYNINNLSAYVSIELNLDVRQEAIAQSTEQLLMHIAQNDCKHIARDFQRNAAPVKRFFQWFAYNTLRLSLFLLTFYYRHTLPKREAD